MGIKTKLMSVAGALAFMTASHAATAEILTFDDLKGPDDFFTANHQGFQFGDNDPATNPWFYSREKLYDVNGNVFYQPHSPSTYVSTDYTLYDNSNYQQATEAIKRSTAFVFDGAYFSGDGQIVYQLYLKNVPVYTSLASSALQGKPTFVSSGYSGFVDSVVVVGHQGYYALDDFTYHNNLVVPAVPEPATWAMMIVGMGLVGASIRRRQKVATRVSYAT